MNATAATEVPSPAYDEGLRLVMPGRRVDAGRGASWIAEGWKLFTRAPLMWIISIVVLFIVALVMNFIPILGGIVFQVLQIVFWAGFIAACRSLEKGGEFEIEHLLAGFRRHFGPLVVVSIIFMVLGLVIAMVYFGAIGFSVMGAALSGDAEAVQRALLDSIGLAIVGALIAFAIAVPIFAAMWFAPALIFMHGVGPIEALKASLGASLRNFVPFLVYGIVMLVLAIVAMIPFGLGMLVYVPLTIASAYASYRDVFTEEGSTVVTTRPGFADAPAAPPPPPLA